MMASDPAAASDAAFDIDALVDAQIHAQRRAPDGRKLESTRWAWRAGEVWHFPAALTSPRSLSPVFGETIVDATHANKRAFGFFLAVAIRQDLWRSLQGVPGLMPVIRVTPDTPLGRTHCLIGCLVPPARVSPAIQSVIDDLASPPRVRAWVSWAGRQSRGIPRKA